MNFTKKQAECILNANARWNIFSGATRAGKTVVTYFLLLMRIKELPEGRCIMIGKTISTLEYNVLMPMREMLGSDHVSEMKINSAGLRYVIIFGREFRCVGANDKRSVTKIQGSGLIYAYGDEVATWDKNIFDMLKSRLDSKHAKFDGTTNPDAPNHWLKKFIDEAETKKLSAKLFHFVIDDNTFLDEEFVEQLKKEYAGTVYYDRYILGRWVAAEGSIYTAFISNKDDFIIDSLPSDEKGFISIGVDFGGSKSGQSFNATVVNTAKGRITTVKDYWNDTKMTPTILENELIKFIKAIQSEYPQFNIVDIRADSAEQVLINGLNSALINNKMRLKVSNAIKGEINERIRFYTRLFGSGRYFILKTCKHTIDAYEGAVWRETNGMQDERLDDGTSNIDTLDSQEYSTEPYMKILLKIINYGGKK